MRYCQAVARSCSVVSRRFLSQSAEMSGGTDRRRNERGGRPSHLKGREIGMWHANKQKKREIHKEMQTRIKITMKENDRNTLACILDEMDKKYGACRTGGHYERSRNQTNESAMVSWRSKVFASSKMQSSPSEELFQNERVAGTTHNNLNQTDEINDEETTNVDDEIVEEIDQVDDEYDENLLVGDELLGDNDDVGGLKISINREITNDSLIDQLNTMRSSSRYKKFLQFREKLPTYAVRQRLVDVVRNSRVTIVEGQTGCGKSTQIPQLILDDQIAAGFGMKTFIVCTEPRRIAAISLASRVSDERAEPLGTSVGYQIRLTNELPRAYGSVVYCTTGVVLQWLKSDPRLSRVSHLILDEIHERDILSDFLMIIIKDLLTVRNDLSVVLMSATLDVASFVQYFRQFNPIVQSIDGLMYNVESYYLEDIFKKINYRPTQSVDQSYRKRFQKKRERNEYFRMIDDFYRSKRFSDDVYKSLNNWDDNKIDPQLVLNVTKHICCKETDSDGAILIFLPGWEEITTLYKSMSRDPLLGNSSTFDLIPLHSMLPLAEQQRVFECSPAGRRKIILATNIAETSVTIDDVVYVIDCGKIKQNNFDQISNVSTLDLDWISVSNMTQRRGRAGRCRNGFCFHLYPSFYPSIKFLPKPKPEMTRIRMENLCLQVRYLGLTSSSCVDFLGKSLDPPPIETVLLALDELYEISAMDKDENLTNLGKRLATIPVDPHLGKMLLLSSVFLCVDPISTVVACLDFKDPFITPFGMEREVDKMKYDLCPAGTYSDYALWINVFNLWQEECRQGNGRNFAREHFLNHSTLVMIEKLKEKFVHTMQTLGFGRDGINFNRNSNDFQIVSAVIVAGLYPKAAVVRRSFGNNRPPIMSTKKIRRLQIHKRSVNSSTSLREPSTVVYHVCVRSSGGVYLHDCGRSSPLALVLFSKNLAFIQETKSEGVVKVDDTFRFNTHPNTFRLLLRLNLQIKRLIDRICDDDSYVARDDGDFLPFVEYLFQTESY